MTWLVTWKDNDNKNHQEAFDDFEQARDFYISIRIYNFKGMAKENKVKQKYSFPTVA